MAKKKEQSLKDTQPQQIAERCAPRFKFTEDGGGSIHLASDKELGRLLDMFCVEDASAAGPLASSALQLETDALLARDAGPANATLALIEAMKPQDVQESMLCSQMVGAHLIAMECMRRSKLEAQSFEGRDLNLRHAERLMRIFAQQLDALNKHRGKGQQKVTVEHVTVNEGGQAVVGSVER